MKGQPWQSMITAMIWTCPHCNYPLAQQDRTLRCDNNHAFDLAKEGYVNLLPVNQKRSKVPGDSPEMIAARREIHQAGLYAPLASKLAEIISGLKSIETLLDIGCGEGYYDQVLLSSLPDLAVYGIDISKAAVRLAAKRSPNQHYAVASAFRLPVATDSVDLAMRIFAPSDDRELHRVLTPGGYYLEVGPAEQHLWELRTALYETPEPHEPLRSHVAQFSLDSAGDVDYSIEINRAEIRNLVEATPFAHKGNQEKRAALISKDRLSVSMSFNWRLYRKE